MLNLRALYSASICVLQVTRYPSVKTTHLLLRKSLHTPFPLTTRTHTYNINVLVPASRVFSTGTSRMFPPRRSARLQAALASTPGDNESATRTRILITEEKQQQQEQQQQQPRTKKRKEAPQTSTAAKISAAKKSKAPKTAKKVKSTRTLTPRTSTKDTPATIVPPLPQECLPRSREQELLLEASHTQLLYIMGIDEAGRGPLAGPVVAAAAIIPTDIPGITDSKKITREETREELYEKIISSPNARWAVAIGDAARVDEVNILQATLECMRNAARGLMELEQFKLGSTCIVPVSESSENTSTDMHTPGNNESDDDKDVKIVKVYPREKVYSSKIHGCYIVCGINDADGEPMDINVNGNTSISDDLKSHDLDEETTHTSQLYYALVDGNRLPKEMPCDAEPIVKGDSKEYAIAAASILAKVTRDRLMHEYDALYPEFNLKQHKGYPTAAHMSKVREFGASPIHRRTFAPLKHMSFDDDGRIIVSSMEDSDAATSKKVK